MSIALRVLPSKLELNRRDGSGRLAPRAKVSFTAFVYVSPVQTIPSCDQTGTPFIAFDGFFHLRSSVISASASRISARMRSRVSSRHPPDDVLVGFFSTVILQIVVMRCVARFVAWSHREARTCTGRK